MELLCNTKNRLRVMTHTRVKKGCRQLSSARECALTHSFFREPDGEFGN